MPSESNASPIVVGDRVIAVSEPTRVLGLSAETGQILWQRDLGYADSLSGAEATEARALLKRSEKDAAELEGLRKELMVLLREARRVGAKADIKKRRIEVMNRFNTLKMSVDRVAHFRTPPTNDLIGYSSATPVSDGSAVFVVFANGVVASLDLEGGIRWVKWFGDLSTAEMNGYAEGHAASPLLAGGRLILPFRRLMGLDPSTGEVVWTSGDYRDFGSPVSATVDGVAVVVTPNGRIVRARDGRVLAHGIDKVWHSGPLVHGDKLYYIGTGAESDMLRRGAATARSFEVSNGVDGASIAKLQWEQNITKNLFFASPVLHDGILFAISRDMSLTAMRAADGRVLYETDIGAGYVMTGTSGRIAFPSLAIAGGLLYASGSDGSTTVIKPGPKYKVLARNTLEPLRSSPFFKGRRLYIRGMKKLYCIQAR
jgi:outer membrane protein assembly factor BamB